MKNKITFADLWKTQKRNKSFVTSSDFNCRSLRQKGYKTFVIVPLGKMIKYNCQIIY